jgi:hypothetical protein
MQKGLFSSLFLFTMILLLTPSLIISDQSTLILNNFNHVDQLTLSVDNVIKDALFEQTFSEFCTINNKNNYDARVITFLDNLFFEINNTNNKHFSFLCEYDSFNSFFDASNIYSGDVEIKCKVQSYYSSIEIKKKLYFENIIILYDVHPCEVGIKDILDSSKEYVRLIREHTLP